MFDTEFDPAAPARLVGDLTDTARAEARLMAARTAAVADLLAQRTAELNVEGVHPNYMILTGFARTSAEVGAALNLTPGAASRLVGQAEALRDRLPRLAGLLANAQTDWRTVEIVIARTRFVAPRVMVQIDSELAEEIGEWQCWSDGRITTTVDAKVTLLNPDAIAQREHAIDRRRVNVKPLGDGTAKIDAIVTTRAGLTFDAKLSEMSAGLCAKDPRSKDQRRSDAIEALAQGRELSCECGTADCPARSTAEPPEPVKVVVNVIAERDTVVSDGAASGYVCGFGVIDAEQVREFADQGTMRLVTEPKVDAAAALRYQPTVSVQRWVRCRDLTCRFPGCEQSAEDCDLDHTVPFDHNAPAHGGLTVPENLKCLCRFHHRLKTFGGWHDEQYPDGTVIWTSPSGREYRTTPGGADLFNSFRPAPCRAPAPAPAPKLSRAARLGQSRAKNRRLRPVNEAYRYTQKARRRELDRRRNRNRMRVTLKLFKGDEPSTSPYCTWINDPFDPEELPPDWQPPPPPPPDPQDPPF
ncbi:HNH endonuclease signature motif containing protein [Mycolicibacterium neworleansense]|uniref:13e12 repeat-containing protein n=1 Tax=Mycolicibacterium neworleansense TaxID=146018 RepID=A0A0H5RVC4_9MYCO|nr:HNH endonuclease signature motif containing protein [Mycolicibacterium neworleansense]CRZ17726.1 13e12 repeat-containing protein [Mycolicibacterium neworleansense]